MVKECGDRSMVLCMKVRGNKKNKLMKNVKEKLKVLKYAFVYNKKCYNYSYMSEELIIHVSVLKMLKAIRVLLCNGYNQMWNRAGE